MPQTYFQTRTIICIQKLRSPASSEKALWPVFAINAMVGSVVHAEKYKRWHFRATACNYLRYSSLVWVVLVRRFSRHSNSYRRCLVLFTFGGGLLGCCVQRIAYFLCYKRTAPYHTCNEVVTAHVFFLVLAASFCRVFGKTLLFCFKHRLCLHTFY